jgi:hypothetical protein
MKALGILAASLAIPAVIASAQTPALTPSTSGQAQYIPLFGTSGGTSSGNNSSVWYIDTARSLIVLCTQTPGGSGAQSFSCNAQAVQTLPAGTAPATPQGGAPGSGTSGTGSTGATTPGTGAPAGASGTSGTTGTGSTTGAAGANPMGS